MTHSRAVNLLSQMYLPWFDDEEKEALTFAINAIQKYQEIEEQEAAERFDEYYNQ